MRGYRVEEWSQKKLDKVFALPIRDDFQFRLVETRLPFLDTMAATTLPVWLDDASLPAPDQKDKLSVLVGALKRLAAKVHFCNFKKMKKILAYSRKYIFPQFRSFKPEEIPDTLSWISNINHPEARKEELRKVYERMLQYGLYEAPEYGGYMPTLAESHVKDEPYEEEKACRWINSSLDVVKVAFGPIADKCMEILCENPAMIKTVPVAERAKAIYEDLGGSDVIAQSSDATAMEDHYANIAPMTVVNGNKVTVTTNDPRYRISNELMLYMCGSAPVPLHLLRAVRFLFYTTPGLERVPTTLTEHAWSGIRDATTLKDFFSSIIDGYRHLKMRHFGHVVINAILCSGEMNTSFKNTASMYVMTNFASYDLTNGRVPHVRSKNEGDDSLAVYHNGNGPTEQWWRSYGWVVKVEFIGPVNEASFCGLVFDPHDLVSCPNIRKAIAKLGWTGRKYVQSTYKCRMSLLRSKALSMACEYNDVPVLGAFAHRLLELTKHVHVRKSVEANMDMFERERYQRSLKERVWQRLPTVGWMTRCLVERLQGISVSTQLVLEDKLASISLGSFSLPELDFPEPWKHNQSRLYTFKELPRFHDLVGRKRVVDTLRRIVIRDTNPKYVDKLLKELKRLESGSI
jgi:hypothetical protein